MDNLTDLFALTKTAITDLPLLVRFMIGFTLFLLVPGISERFKIPGMVGLILVGLLGGPSGIDIWPDNPVLLTAFSEVGVLLVLFYAGLEIDLAVFKRVGGRAVSFGLATLLLPLSAASLAAARSSISCWIETACTPWVTSAALTPFAIRTASVPGRRRTNIVWYSGVPRMEVYVASFV